MKPLGYWAWLGLFTALVVALIAVVSQRWYPLILVDTLALGALFGHTLGRAQKAEQVKRELVETLLAGRDE